MPTIYPNVNDPLAMKLLTAERELRTIRKSVISAPSWPPMPNPAVPMALGLDQVSSGSFAMTIPVPARALNRNPALKIVKIAKPFACSRTAPGITPSRPLFELSTKDLTVEMSS